MKRLLPAAAAALLCAIAATPAARAADADPIVAQRGTDAITASQARALIAAADPQTRAKLASDPAVLKDLLRGALIQRAILAEAATQKWEQRPEVVAQIQQAHDQVVERSFLAAQAPLPAGYPAEADVVAAYEQNKARFNVARSFHLTHIILPASAIHGDDGRKRLADLRARVMKTHMNFEDAARTLPGSQYEDLRFVPETAMADAIKPQVTTLPEGGISQPICNAGGCTLLRVISIRPAGPEPLVEVHDQLVRALRQQKVQQEVQAYAARLNAKQAVQINEIQLSRVSGGNAATP